jgi:hypothetical protein
MGQFLLAWEAEVRSFAPDVVLAPMAWIHFERTVSRYETGAFPATVGRRLWIRPTFGLEHGRLVREPARDFNEFKEIQNRVIATDFGGRRVARRAPVLFTWQQWKSLEAGLYQHGQRAARLAEAVQESVLAPEVLTVNLKVIETLAEEVKHSGADLVIVDLSPVFGPRGARFGDALRTVCVKVRCGYLPAGEELRAANERGLATRWAYDGHFNETGNAILADAMYRWVVGRDEPGAAPDRTGAAATGGAALGARTRRSLRHTG